MATRALHKEAPGGYEQAAELLAECARDGLRVRVRGGGTKLGWGPVTQPDVELSTSSLNAIVEHNAGDLTAILQAGVRVADAQRAFGEAGQMLALDPPLRGDATIGGVVAAGDSGPLRHRYGAARDLVLGVRVALSDGTVARAGGKVIKNVAGYDLAKLFSGSFGTLGAILEVAVRLHPERPTMSAAATFDDPERLAGAARRLTHARHEAWAIDVAWRDGHGGVLARYAGDEARAQAEAAASEIDGGSLLEDDAEAWEDQRLGQRGDLVVRVSTTQSGIADVLRAADRLDGAVVGRAGLGLMWVRLPANGGADAVRALRDALAPAACVLLDAPEDVRAEVDPWGIEAGPELELMRRVKQRFDPAGVLV
jgi:glycolate dehydrogenase FAD-binding subunit